MFHPIFAHTRVVRRPIEPAFYNCVKLIFVRDGSAVFHSDFGQQPVGYGDAILLAADVLCGSEPEEIVTFTTIYLDPDYLMDQVRWQHTEVLLDRFEASELAKAMYPQPAQILRLGAERLVRISPWLDELAVLSAQGGFATHFNRMQALWFSMAHLITPFVTTTPTPRLLHNAHLVKRTFLREQWIVPVRMEARRAAHLLRGNPGRHWTLDQLADAVHLSASQLREIFFRAYGNTPLGYLTLVRAEQLAKLLRDSDLPVEAAMHAVGWHSTSHGTAHFRRIVGMNPGKYRRLHSRP